jgi:3'-phosphoadenosine 5'-phosphosulfate sulfotransferase
VSLGRGRALKSQHAMSNTSTRGDVQGDWREIRSFGGARGAKVKLQAAKCQRRQRARLLYQVLFLGGSDFCDNWRGGSYVELPVFI